MKKICLLLAVCMVFAACSAFAESAADTTSLTDQARTALEAGDYKTAVPLLQKAAEAGDAQAQAWLGNFPPTIKSTLSA